MCSRRGGAECGVHLFEGQRRNGCRRTEITKRKAISRLKRLPCFNEFINEPFD